MIQVQYLCTGLYLDYFLIGVSISFDMTSKSVYNIVQVYYITVLDQFLYLIQYRYLYSTVQVLQSNPIQFNHLYSIVHTTGIQYTGAGTDTGTTVFITAQ